MLDMALDLNAYWTERGQFYRENDGHRLQGAFYKRQEKFFADVLDSLDPRPDCLLEYGCGFGRVTRAVALKMPDVPITATDLVEEQLNAAREYCEGLDNVCFGQEDLLCRSKAFMIDVAYASEVMIHVPPAAVSATVRRILQDAHTFVHDFDPNVEPGSGNDPHCWNHDFKAIYEGMGLKVEAHEREGIGILVVRR